MSRLQQRIRAFVRPAVAWCVLVLSLAIGFAWPVIALERKTYRGIEYYSGGVGREEIEEMRFLALQYSLKVVAAARERSQFLADVRVVIRRGSEVVLEAVMDGPWLLADLPPGRYVVAAEFRGEWLEQRLDLPPDGHRELVFVFTRTHGD